MSRQPLGWRWPRWLPWALLPVLAIPALWPYTQGWPATADGALHLMRLIVLDHQVQQGLLFPRWSPELVLGYGYPVFNFYAPATFFLAELLHLSGLGYYAALMGTFGLMVLAAGYGMYLLAADVLTPGPNRWAALVAAVAYMYSPYLLTNVFVRGAIGEVGAQALLPWIFWSFRRLLRQPHPAAYVLPAALSLGGLAVTHNITLLFLPPALLGYWVVQWWAGGRAWRRLAWASTGGLAALGVGAVVWLPLLAERQYLAATAYTIAQQVLPGHVWTWSNFLDWSVIFSYASEGPFKLGLVQLGLALAGVLLARRRDIEWLYLIGLAVVTGLGIGAWALPLWLNSPLLLIAQFPWRLLTLMSLPLALLAAGWLARPLPARWLPVLSLLALGLIIVTQRPHPAFADMAAPDEAALNLASVAQFEFQTGALGTSSAREFFPRWVQQMELDPGSAAESAGTITDLQLEQAGPYARTFLITATASAPLRLTDFYFPGWHAQLESGEALPTYASTSMGLLTIAVPAGAHRVRVFWQDTPWQRGGTALSLLTFGALLIAGLAQPQRRWLMVVPGVLLLLTGATLRPPPGPRPVTAPQIPFSAAGLKLLGYQTEQTPAGALYLLPYWQTEAHPLRLRVDWQILTLSGQVVGQFGSEPYFAAGRSDRWPAGALVDDAYRLALPAGLPAGEYRLALSVSPWDQPAPRTPVEVSRLHLEAVPALTQPVPVVGVSAQFGPSIRLAGYDLTLNGQSAALTAAPLVTHPNDVLVYTLYWQSQSALSVNYHSLLHFLGAGQQVLLKEDQAAGPLFYPSRLWDPYHLQAETYRVQIPARAAGGVYWPNLGLYQLETLERLPVSDASGQAVGDTLALGPLKVVATPARPQHAVNAGLADLAVLLGYDLALPPEGLHPGSLLTVTLYYQSSQATDRSYTRFVHLGAVAQADALPQQGLNPTWSWVPGEVIVDQAVLVVSDTAALGDYALQFGFYDPAADGERLALTDAAGQLLPDGLLTLTTLPVGP